MYFFLLEKISLDAAGVVARLNSYILDRLDALSLPVCLHYLVSQQHVPARDDHKDAGQFGDERMLCEGGLMIRVNIMVVMFLLA